jgi:4'-phosphopantetheinyl transferase
VEATLFANDAEPWPLRTGVVHVWRFDFEHDPHALTHLLSDDERAIAARFVFAVHREAYIVQHATVRCLLARYTGAAPRDLVFARGARGKPRLAGGELHHNLSHTADVALHAVARDVALGVDVERMNAELDAAALGTIVFAPDEHAIGRDRRGFLRVWCRKEAVLKATGVGLIDDLTSVSVARDRVELDGTIVYLQDLDVGPRHAAALATAAPCAAVSSAAHEIVRLTP